MLLRMGHRELGRRLRHVYGHFFLNWQNLIADMVDVQSWLICFQG